MCVASIKEVYLPTPVPRVATQSEEVGSFVYLGPS